MAATTICPSMALPSRRTPMRASVRPTVGRCPSAPAPGRIRGNPPAPGRIRDGQSLNWRPLQSCGIGEVERIRPLCQIGFGPVRNYLGNFGPDRSLFGKVVEVVRLIRSHSNYHTKVCSNEAHWHQRVRGNATLLQVSGSVVIKLIHVFRVTGMQLSYKCL